MSRARANKLRRSRRDRARDRELRAAVAASIQGEAKAEAQRWLDDFCARMVARWQAEDEERMRCPIRRLDFC